MCHRQTMQLWKPTITYHWRTQTLPRCCAKGLRAKNTWMHLFVHLFWPHQRSPRRVDHKRLFVPERAQVTHWELVQRPHSVAERVGGVFFVEMPWLLLLLAAVYKQNVLVPLLHEGRQNSADTRHTKHKALRSQLQYLRTYLSSVMC